MIDGDRPARIQVAADGTSQFGLAHPIFKVQDRRGPWKLAELFNQMAHQISWKEKPAAAGAILPLARR